MASHHHSGPDNQLPNENPSTSHLLYYPTTPIPQPAVTTVPRNPSPAYMRPFSGRVPSGNLLESSQDAVATYSRLTNGQLLRQPTPANNTIVREEFTGSVSLLIPPLLVLLVIGINGETIKRIQRESGVIRIHIHKPLGTDVFSDRGLPRKCEIWGLEDRVMVARQAIEDIITSNPEWEMILVQQHEVHLILGPDHRDQRMIEQKSNCRIVIPKRATRCNYMREVYLIGTAEDRIRAQNLIHEHIRDRDCAARAGPASVSKTLVVSADIMRYIVGKSGHVLQRIKADTGCRIWYQRMMRCRNDGGPGMVQDVYLDGSDLAVAAAAYAIEDIARGRTPHRIPFSSKTLSNIVLQKCQAMVQNGEQPTTGVATAQTQPTHPILPGLVNEQRPYYHGAENIPPTNTVFYQTYQSPAMPQPGFGYPFPGIQHGWLPYLPYGQGSPASANQAPNTLSMAQPDRGPNNQLPLTATFGQQYQTPAPHVQGLNYYAPSFIPQENTRTYWRQAVQPAVDTFDGGGFVHREIGRNAEPVGADSRQNSSDIMDTLTGMQNLNIGDGGNQAQNTIPSRSGSSHQVSSQRETNLGVNRSSSDSQRTGQFRTALLSPRHEAYRNRNLTYHEGQTYNPLPTHTNLSHRQRAKGNADQVGSHPP